ncbi:hypothetical protein BJX62DRAFT_10787 [Aspergillus germanicus]
MMGYSGPKNLTSGNLERMKHWKIVGVRSKSRSRVILWQGTLGLAKFLFNNSNGSALISLTVYLSISLCRRQMIWNTNPLDTHHVHKVPNEDLCKVLLHPHLNQ